MDLILQKLKTSKIKEDIAGSQGQSEIKNYLAEIKNNLKKYIWDYLPSAKPKDDSLIEIHNVSYMRGNGKNQK